ncbi:MAG: hypothetical protein IKB88_09985 [Clostridia bacterium]|nr:hypothetical protein [Clostridia bacterium]
MIDCWRVLSALREYYSYGETDAELIPICESTARELTARVKPNADCSDIRLINAAAAMANHRLCVKKLHSDEGVTSFKAGDVTVSISPAALAENAEKEKTRAIIAALPLLRDEEFLFRQVSI